MTLNIRGDKIEVTASIKEYIESKLQKLDKYFKDSENITTKVLVRVKNNLDYVEVTIPIGKFIIRAEEKDKDLYAAIDLVVDKLENQIRKNKSKLHDKSKNTNIVFDMVEPEELKEDQEEYEIVKRKTVENKPMDEEEALLQMKLLNHDFFVFENIDENCISVIYRRKDNKYGIINMK